MADPVPAPARRRRAGRPQCDCVAEIEAELAKQDRNTSIVTELFSGAVVIGTEKRDRKVRRGPVLAIASFCPFCGKKYAEGEDPATEAADA